MYGDRLPCGLEFILKEASDSHGYDHQSFGSADLRKTRAIVTHMVIVINRQTGWSIAKRMLPE